MHVEPKRDKLLIQVDESISLHEICHHDARVIFETIDQQREYLARWLPFVENTKELSDTENFIIYAVASGIAAQEYVFRINYEGQFAGLIGFRNSDIRNHRSELGYWLSEPYQHKGIARKSVEALSLFAFEKLNLKEIIIRCAVDNAPSRRVPEATEYTFFKTEFMSEKLSDGTITDVVVYIRKNSKL
ncbi:MAG: ribosomal-protein-serine acetyltransferase [Bacteroidetes bacterium]|nr:MAG: ribosomal-protein-serine acetyltransferase [Bacteroidota bacterium]